MPSTVFFESVISELQKIPFFELNERAVSETLAKRIALLSDEKLAKYSDDEKSLLLKDVLSVVTSTFTKAKMSDKPVYIASAGAPCVGKSTQLEIDMRASDDRPIFVSPDRGAIQGINATTVQSLDPYVSGEPLPEFGMKATYWADHADNKDHAKCYDKWREASIWISELVFLLAVAHKFDIVHDTTHTSPYSKYTFDILKEYGFDITVNVMTAPDADRQLAKESRTIMQVTDVDFNSKVITGEQMTIFMKYADQIYLLHNANFLASEHTKAWDLLAEYSQSGGCQLEVAAADLPEGCLTLVSAMQQVSTKALNIESLAKDSKEKPESPESEASIEEAQSEKAPSLN